jgi:hypothetical protein
LQSALDVEPHWGARIAGLSIAGVADQEAEHQLVATVTPRLSGQRGDVLRHLPVDRELKLAEYPTIGVPQPLSADRSVAPADGAVLGAQQLAGRGHQDLEVVKEGLEWLAHRSRPVVIGTS